MAQLFVDRYVADAAVAQLFVDRHVAGAAIAQLFVDRYVAGCYRGPAVCGQVCGGHCRGPAVCGQVCGQALPWPSCLCEKPQCSEAVHFSHCTKRLKSHVTSGSANAGALVKSLYLLEGLSLLRSPL